MSTEDIHQRSKTPLGVRLIDNATIHPVSTSHDRPGELLMGVFDANGAFVEGSGTDRRSGQQGVPAHHDSSGAAQDGTASDVIYGGDLHMHFGHFLLESSARLRYAKAHPEMPIVWAADHRWTDETIRAWQRELLAVLGVSNEISFITVPTRFARVHVPDIGYRYDDWIHPDHADFLAAWPAPKPLPGRRVWLSRSEIGTDVRTLNADIAERHLARAGWRVVHPEQMSVTEQMTEIALAEQVAGEEGSALHTVLLLDDASGRRFQVIRRRGKEHRNFHTIAAARSVEQQFHSLAGERIIKADGRAVTKIARSSAHLLDALGVPIAQAPPPSPYDRAAARLIRALGTRSVLEIEGVCPFVTMTVAGTDGLCVSERLVADPRIVAGHLERVVELPLARFIDRFGASELRFDVIRVGGVEPKRLLKTFETSMRLASGRTVWIIDGDRVGAEAAWHLHDSGSYDVRHTTEEGVTLYIATARAAGSDRDFEMSRWSRIVQRFAKARHVPSLSSGDLARIRAALAAERVSGGQST